MIYVTSQTVSIRNDGKYYYLCEFYVEDYGPLNMAISADDLSENNFDRVLNLIKTEYKDHELGVYNYIPVELMSKLGALHE